MGWAVYYVVAPTTKAMVVTADPSGNGAAAFSGSTELADSGSIENQFYRATFDLWTGAMTGLEMKSGSGMWRVSGERPGNVIACEQDGGDSWELYGGLESRKVYRDDPRQRFAGA